MHVCHRLELIVILKRQESFKKLSQLLRDSSNSTLNTADVTTAAGADTSESTLRYDDVNVDKLSQPSAVDAMLQQYCDDEAYADLYVDLEPCQSVGRQLTGRVFTAQNLHYILDVGSATFDDC